MSDAVAPASPAAPGLATYSPRAEHYFTWAIRKIVSQFKRDPSTLSSIGDVVAQLKPHADERRYERSVPEADWGDARAALVDAAYAEARFRATVSYTHLTLPTILLV